MQINRIWLGGKMPEKYQAYGQKWLDLNPGYTLHEWGEEEIMDTKWINQDVLDDMYEQSKRPDADMIAYYTHVADVIDKELMLKTGWYFNTDLNPIRPLSHLWNEHSPNAPGLAMEDERHPVNMAMYSPHERDSFFEAVVEELPKRYFSMRGAFMNATTGVQLLESVLARDRGRAFRYVNLYSSDRFNPIHFTDFGYGEEPEYREDQFGEETIAIHLWFHRTNQRSQRILENF